MIDLSALDEGTFQEWIVAQRWFGSKAREVAHIDVAECIPLREEAPQLALALVEARFGEGTHETYQVPLGLRPVDEGWDERVIGEADGWTVYDALADPAAGRELLHRMRSGAERDRRGGHAALPLGGVGGRRAGRDGRRAAGRRRAVELVDRVRRRADPEGVPACRAGREPRARAAALPVRARVPEHRRRWPAGTSSRAASSTRRWGSCRSTWRARATAGSWRWRSSRPILPGCSTRLRSLGQVTGDLHTALGSDNSNPDFAPDEPSQEALSLLTADVDEQIERIFLDLPETEALAPIAGRGQDVREKLQALSHIGAGGRVIRTHGDYHLGQTMLSDRGWVILDFEGEPARPLPERRLQALAAARRRGDAALVLLRRRGRAAAARRSTCRRTGRTAARATFLEGYFDRVEPSLLPPGEAPTRQLLAVFELEKAVYELRYELNNRPDWVSIPVAGILRLLDAD